MHDRLKKQPFTAPLIIFGSIYLVKPSNYDVARRNVVFANEKRQFTWESARYSPNKQNGKLKRSAKDGGGGILAKSEGTFFIFNFLYVRI